MSPGKGVNRAASIRQKLKNKAKETNRPFNQVLQYCAMERFLYRLTRSAHANLFVLKGALLFTVWRQSDIRSTMDIDLLGRTGNDPQNLIRIFQDICKVEIEEDGIVLDSSSVTAESIDVDAEYQGIRVQVRGSLDQMRVVLQIDIGFSDAVFPEPVTSDFPVILEMPAPVLQCYPKETVIAEKLEAMVKLDLLNSRMKDFYDILILSQRYRFEESILRRSIQMTFEKRETELPPVPTAFTDAFSSNPTKSIQWKAFLKKKQLTNITENFSQVIAGLSAFLGPVLDALFHKADFNKTWNPEKAAWE